MGACDLVFGGAEQLRSDASAPNIWINVQAFHLVIRGMNHAGQRAVEDSYEEVRPHGLGVRPRWVGRGECLHSPEGQLGRPRHKPGAAK